MFGTNTAYKEGRRKAPDILILVSIDCPDGRKALRGLAGGYRGLGLVRLDRLHVLAVLKPGGASELKG